MPAYQKTLRLPASQYRGRRFFFITIVTAKRRPFFAAPSAGQWLLDHLLRIAAGHLFSLDAYCIMPDHLHLLCHASLPSSDLIPFVNSFKQRTGYAFRKKYSTPLWQMRFYDHILRPDDRALDIACYIWSNPVRKGICSDPHTYPLSGSQTLDWMNHHSTAPEWRPPWKTQTTNVAPSRKSASQPTLQRPWSRPL